MQTTLKTTAVNNLHILCSYAQKILCAILLLSAPVVWGQYSGPMALDVTASKHIIRPGETFEIKGIISTGNVPNGTPLFWQFTLPQGIHYVANSSQLSTNAVSQPIALANGVLQWSPISVQANQSIVVKFTVQANAVIQTTHNASVQGVLMCTLNGQIQACSSIQKLHVTLQEESISHAASVFGRVYLDCSRSRLAQVDGFTMNTQLPVKRDVAAQHADEVLGVPNVRIILPDGRSVTTDGQGRYSISNMKARTTVLKLDPDSLPADWEGLTLNNRHTGDPHSVFVDLSKGEMRKVNFADGACAPKTVEEVQKRLAQAKAHADTVIDTSGKTKAATVLKPMVGVGIVEGVLALHRLRGNQLGQLGRGSFEDELRCIAQSDTSTARWVCNGMSLGQHTNLQGSTALYFKGQIKGDYLLTLAYDSNQDRKAQLYKDIQAEQYYPIYGDSAAQELDARSSGKLYVKVEHGTSSVLYGDMVLGGNQSVRQLTDYQRTLNGARVQFNTADRLSHLDLFTSRDTFSQKVVEYPANGTSGPFVLGSTAIANTESVHVLVRNRTALNTVISTRTLVRHLDYVIEPLSGDIRLKAPLPSVDAQLNPISIVIRYEIDSVSTPFWTAGGHVSHQVVQGLTLGGVAVTENKPQNRFSVYGTYLQAQVNQNIHIEAEWAKTHNESNSTVVSGNANRLGLRYQTEIQNLKIDVQTVDRDFANPSSTAVPGKAHVLAEYSYRLNPNTSWALHGSHEAIASTQLKQTGVLLSVTHQMDDNGPQLTAGLRFNERNHDTDLSEADQLISINTRVQASLSPRSTVYAQFEKALTDGRKNFGVGTDYRFDNGGRVYAKHEFLQQIFTDNLLNSQTKRYGTYIGLDTPLTPNTQVFTEYRVADALSAPQAVAALGLRQVWQYSPELTLRGSFEKTYRVQGIGADQGLGLGTALTFAGSYLGAPSWRTTHYIERRTDEQVLVWSGGLAAMYKYNRDWSVLTRHDARVETPHDKTIKPIQQMRSQLGLAYRDTKNDLWNALTKVEFRHEKNTANLLARSVGIWANHLNYQVSRQWWVSSHMAYKRVLESAAASDASTTGLMLGARFNYDINHDWDIGVMVLGIVNRSHSNGATRQQGLGTEIGYRVQENLWLSVGYNVWGAKDKDFIGNEHTDSGLYIRMRFKFDETLFDRPKDQLIDRSSHPANLTQVNKVTP